jgi:hypothetical protein
LWKPQTAVFRDDAFLDPRKCSPLLLTAHGEQVWLAAQIEKSLAPQVLEPAPQAEGVSAWLDHTVATPRWFQRGDLLAAADRTGHWILNSMGLLRHCDDAGLEQQSIRLPLQAPIAFDAHNAPLFTHLCMTSLGPLAVVNHQVFLLTSKGKLLERELSKSVTSVAPSALGTAIRVALFHEEGATMLWPTIDGFSCTRLPDDLDAPRGVFLLSGRLVVWSATSAGAGMLNSREYRFFRVTSHEVTDLGSSPAGNTIPRQLLRTDQPNEWALLNHAGRVEIWQLDGSTG